jgi:signal peptidase II
MARFFPGGDRPTIAGALLNRSRDMSLERFPTATESGPALLRLAALITVAVFLADIASKNWAIATVGHGYVDLGLIALTVVENDALAFSIGAGLLDYAVVFALRLAALAGILLLTWRFRPRSLRAAVGVALLVGGGLGNLSDLVFRDGAVVDFISTTPVARALTGSPVVEGIVMNLADVWILAGLALLYPAFRSVGLGTQRRFREAEARVLGREWAPDAGEAR